MALDVLIVDDSAAIRKILQRVLVQANVGIGKIIEANDGREGLERMTAENVGLVFSDINMPNMDGLEFLQLIRANPNWKNVPVVMVTTEGSQDKVFQALQMGASGYVKKPFTPEQIREKLGTIGCAA
ncbi:response regulator [Bryobacterales bacterium F-183]|nr:response regulator [Bryobacterales bacterium F-183]